MAELPSPVSNLINAFSRLPGIGPKSASRLAFYILTAPEEVALRLAEALQEIQSATAFCPNCFNITLAGNDQCEVCADPRRDSSIICVVEQPIDLLVIERTQGFGGKYHVLHGVLSPIDGIGPDDIRINPLITRIRSGGIKEVIIATNPSMEGDATALYLQQQLNPLAVRITRIARGLPMGGDLEYADQSTLLRALAGRQEMN